MSYPFKDWSWAELERAINTHYFDETVARQAQDLLALAKMPGQKKHYLNKLHAYLKERGLDWGSR